MGTWLVKLRGSLAYWSQRLNVAASVLIAYVVAYPDKLNEVVELLPDEYRPIGGIVAGFVAFLVVSWARLAPQPGITPKPDAQ
jgi:hypothetical protein